MYGILQASQYTGACLADTVMRGKTTKNKHLTAVTWRVTSFLEKDSFVLYCHLKTYH
jgi:hypothetical protein